MMKRPSINKPFHICINQRHFCRYPVRYHVSDHDKCPESYRTSQFHCAFSLSIWNYLPCVPLASFTRDVSTQSNTLTLASLLLLLTLASDLIFSCSSPGLLHCPPFPFLRLWHPKIALIRLSKKAVILEPFLPTLKTLACNERKIQEMPSWGEQSWFVWGGFCVELF